MVLLLFSCSTDSSDEISPSANSSASSAFAKPSGVVVDDIWSFDDLTGWTDASQVGSGNFQLQNGILNIFTHANTWERSKVETTASFGAGTYSWNVYVPTMGVGDMTSIGAFIYSDDTHELDFEIGYGSQDVRTQLGAATDDLVVYMDSQANPPQSVRITIKREQWYSLTLQLVLNSKGRYVATWKINDVAMATAQLSYGNRANFKILCSVENLQFMGDHIPQSQNYALFNSVEYKSN